MNAVKVMGAIALITLLVIVFSYACGSVNEGTEPGPSLRTVPEDTTVPPPVPELVPTPVPNPEPLPESLEPEELLPDSGGPPGPDPDLTQWSPGSNGADGH